MKLSVVIPAHNEPELCATVEALTDRLLAEKIDHEVLIVNDHSTDDTENVSIDLSSRFPSVRYVNNPDPPGFGGRSRKWAPAICSSSCIASLKNGFRAAITIPAESRTAKNPYRASAD